MEQVFTNAAAYTAQRRVRSIAAVRNFYHQSSEILRATGVLDWAKQTGDEAPTVTLPGARGEVIALSNLWRKGPLVVIFYRGESCSICMRQLRTWQAHAASLGQLGVSLVAISPEPADRLRHTMDTQGLGYSLLSDRSLHAANGFNVAMSLPPELVDLYAQWADAAVLNVDGQWELPIPATFLIGQCGRIRFARVELDARKRTAPDDVMPTLRDMRLPPGQRPSPSIES